MKLTTGFLLVSVFLASCASQQGPDYAQAWDEAPIPTDPDAVRGECGRVRVAMADEQSRGETAQAMMSGPNAPMFRQAIQNKERQRLAYLDDRASRLNCRAAFSSAPAPTPALVPVVLPNQDSHMNFDQCFAKCKSLTNRDDNQCFDACK